MNPNVTMDTIKKNIHLKWNWYWLSANKNFDLSIILDYPDKNWNWHQIFSMNLIPKQFVENKLIECKLNWQFLGKNPKITMDFIEANLDKNWSWIQISDNDFTLDRELFIENSYKKFSSIQNTTMVEANNYLSSH